MDIKQTEERLNKLDEQINELILKSTPADIELLRQIKADKSALLSAFAISLSASQRVVLARNPNRPSVTDYINSLCTDFLPFAGDRRQGDDQSILGGIALYHGMPITVIGHKKGKTLDENMKFNFGMPNPEGYRKAERLMLQAEKFNRPILTFIDTPGAYPGLEAEARGQGEAIARCLAVMGNLSVPIISVVTGEGGSGGALAIGVADRLIMLENAIFSILSPEGFSSILWKDPTRWEEAAALMKLTANDLKTLGIADEIIPEHPLGAHYAPNEIFAQLDKAISMGFKSLLEFDSFQLRESRYKKLRAIGNAAEGSNI